MRERNQTLFCVAYSSKTSSDALFRVRDIKLYSNESGLWARGFLHTGSSKKHVHLFISRMGSETFLLVFLFFSPEKPLQLSFSVTLSLHSKPASSIVSHSFHPQMLHWREFEVRQWSKLSFFCPSPTPAFFPSPEWCHSASDHKRSEGVSEASDGSLSLQINRTCPLTLSVSFFPVLSFSLYHLFFLSHFQSNVVKLVGFSSPLVLFIPPTSRHTLFKTLLWS